MREIKFRARDRNNKWIYGTGIVQVEHNTYDTDKWELVQKVNYDELDNYYPSYETEEIDIKTLGQYTGLKDKNGKEIYERDIVKINAHSYDFGFEKDRIGEIRFLEGCFGFYKELSEKKYLFNELSTEFGYGELEYYEVIGNIYENPELLEDKE